MQKEPKYFWTTNGFVPEQKEPAVCENTKKETFTHNLTLGVGIAFIIIFIVFLFVGQKEWNILFGMMLPFGWSFSATWKHSDNELALNDSCMIPHEGRCAGVVSCIQVDVDECRHVCEMGIFTIKDKKRKDSSDPPWTVPIREQKCSTPSCRVMVPYVEGDEAPGLDVLFCSQCADNLQANLEMTAQEFEAGHEAVLEDEMERRLGFEPTGPKWMPCCVCRKVQVDVNDGMDACVFCLGRQ